MNRRGFTLIELLMTIAIIAILSLVLVPNIVAIKNKNDVKSCQSLEKNIISAVKMYAADNKYTENFSCNTPKNIKLKVLVEHGYLTEPITNPKTKVDINPNEVEVTVTYDCTTRTFSGSIDLGC